MTTMSGTRTAEIGGLWWIAHYQDGKMTGLEEHDWHEGGGIDRTDLDQTWEDFLIKRMLTRIIGDSQAIEDFARNFLASDERKMTFKKVTT